MTTAINRRVIAEYDGLGWLVMDEHGNLKWYATAAKVVEAIRRADARRGVDVAVTRLEWTNTPEGFEAPR